MTDDRWKDVKSRVEGLGLKLKLHLEQENDDHDDDEDRETRTQRARAAFDDLGDKLEDAFEAFGNAAKDPAVRADVKDIGQLLKDAMQETLSTAGVEVRKAGDRVRDATSRGDGSGDAEDSAEPTPPPPAGDSPFKDSPDDDTQDDVAT